jgi:hypothetical protein
VVLNEADLVQTEEQVLSMLEGSAMPFSPVDLIDQLKARHVSEFLVRAAIWYLIDKNEIELTRDRLLKRVGAGPGVGMVGSVQPR